MTKSKDLFGNEIIDKPIRVNIYADEIFKKECPYTKDEWFYIGIILEKLDNSLLDDILIERFCNNFDRTSIYFEKNNKIVHWNEIRIADTKNICMRWFKYILESNRSRNKFFSYILGINNSKLNIEEFDIHNKFNSIYNRFFRSAILYALKTLFPKKQIIIENIYHEEGQQEFHKYFPWHCIYKIDQKEENMIFRCSEIKFLPKDHKKDKRSNLIQLSDTFMGACIGIIHGIHKSKKSKYREELMDCILPLVQRMIKEPKNKNSHYQHANRIMIRFFPNQNTKPDDIRRVFNHFYSNRKLYYLNAKNIQLMIPGINVQTQN